MEININNQDAFRAKGGIATVVWLFEASLEVVILIITIVGTTKRTKKILYVFHMCNMIKIKLNKMVPQPEPSLKSERKTKIICCLIIISIFLIPIINIIHYYYSLPHLPVYKYILATLFQIEDVVICLMGLLFTCIVYKILTILKHLNLVLETNLDELKIKDQSSEQLDKMCINIHRVYEIHVHMYDLVKKVETIFDAFILFLLNSSFLHLLVMCYLILVYDKIDDKLFKAILIAYFFYEIGILITRIEPCHNTAKEARKCKQLMSKMSLLVSNQHPFFEALELFSNRINIYKLEYSPMDIYSVNRGFALSIFANVVSYLVILNQFQTVADKI